MDTKKEYKIGYDDEVNADEIKADEIGANEFKADETRKNPATCIYDEICSRAKMCGDCAADEFESERNEEVWKNFKIDRKIALRGGYNSD